MHRLLLVPSEFEQRNIQRTAVAYLERFQAAQVAFLVPLDGENGGGLTADLRAEVPTDFHAAGNKVQYHHDTSVIDTGQTIKFFDQLDALALVVDRTDQVGNAVDHHQMDTAVLIVVPVHAPHDGLQTIAPRNAAQAIAFERFRRLSDARTTQDHRYVFVELR